MVENKDGQGFSADFLVFFDKLAIILKNQISNAVIEKSAKKLYTNNRFICTSKELSKNNRLSASQKSSPKMTDYPRLTATII